MDDIDELEAQALASKWVRDISAKVGLRASRRQDCDDSPRQVHSLNDEIDQNEHKCRDADKHDKPADGKYARGGEISLFQRFERSRSPVSEVETDLLAINQNQQERDGKNNFGSKDFYEGLSSPELRRDHVYSKSNDVLIPCEKVMMPTLQNPAISNDELFDIWEFDESQKQRANCYLKKACTKITMEKENLPNMKNNFANSEAQMDFAVTNVLSPVRQKCRKKYSDSESQKQDGILDTEMNNNFCKICPVCKESNPVSVNWCEECGKALISVEATEVRKLSVKNEPTLAENNGTETLKKESILTSKLNPNCAEFVSAYAQSSKKYSPPRVPNSSIPKCEQPALVHMSPTSSGQISYHNGEKAKNDNIYKYYGRIYDEKRSGDFKSNSFTESSKFEKKNDKSNKRRNRRNRRRSSSFDLDSNDPLSFGYCQETGLFSHSFSPRNEYGSPGNRFPIHQQICNQQQQYPGGSPRVYGVVYGICELDANQGAGFEQTRLPYNQHEIRNEHSFPRYDRAQDFQGFDFENPPLDNPAMSEQASRFNEMEFSRSFIQNALHQQFEYLYGPSKPPEYPHVMQNEQAAFCQPNHVYSVNHPTKQDPPYHRAYQKKKLIENGIDSPRISKNLLKYGKSRCGTDTDGKRHPQQNASEMTANDFSQEHQSESTAIKVPPLKLDDLENYDQVLSLIRTSREEALPYLCLPEELILYIFSFLGMSDLCQCARVCHQFYRISIDESLWKEITIRKRKDLNDEILNRIAKKSPKSLTITQCHSKHITEQGIRSLFQSCGENLLDLDFSACTGNALVGELILLHVSTRCRNLRSLDISWSNISDIGIQAVCEAVTRLECICMNGCQTITDNAIKCIASLHGHSIRVLEIFGCFNISQVSLAILKESCPNMETLNIGQCHKNEASEPLFEKVSNSSVSEVVKKMAKLENIDLRGCKQIKDNAIQALASSCPQLSTLVIANCYFVTDAALLAIASGLANIRCIDVCGCPKITDRGIQAIAKSCGKLQMFDLSSTKASDKAVMSLANYCFKSLETLKISFCHKITEISLEHLARKCPRLSLLHLYGCHRIRNLTRVQSCRETLTIEN